MGKYKLLYFDVRGRAQPIRYLCVDNNIEFEDVVAVTMSERQMWLSKVKETTPFGQLPVLKDGEFEVAHSNAILRYLARKHDLYPEDIVESAKVDMINDQVQDIREAYVYQLIYNDFEGGRSKADYMENLPAKLKPLEKHLKAWGNDFISSKISFADYNMFDLLDIHEILAPGCLDAYPTVKAYYQRIGKRPHIQKMRESEAFKKLNVNGNGKQ